MSTQSLNPDQNVNPSQGFLHILASGAVHELGDILAIGRSRDNHLFLEDNFISLRHARIERHSQGFLVRDLRSRNGTFVNGSRVVQAFLNDGDRVRLGKTELKFSHRPRLDDHPVCLQSRNGAWQAQLNRLPAIGYSDQPVLILGPSGCGKEIIAKTIHEHSARREHPFISVNCSAISESLVESELFGHIRGSFTGAAGDRKGAFESARQGTLFLDEIGDLPLSLQPKLLRALENKEIKPVGSDRTVPIDVRIVAATHKKLRQKVREQEFREDLYYRLHVLQVDVPSLTQRMEDFDDLLYTFAKEMRIGFTLAAINRLKEHTWPGNIRELKNTVVRAKALYSDQKVTAEQVDSLIDDIPDQQCPERTSHPIIQDVEKKMIVERLTANKGNQRKTAHDLGLPKSTLHDRIRSYNITLEDFK